MKTQNISFGSLVILSLLFASCKKEFSTPYVTSESIVSTVQTAGAILDLGVIDADVHHMIVSLNDVTLTLNGESNATTPGSINIDFYTNSDAIIPDGTYTFSKDNNYAPFTFKSATIVTSALDPMGSQSFDLTYGSITLTRTGVTYSISFNGQNSTGIFLQGAFSGDLSYSDTVPTY